MSAYKKVPVRRRLEIIEQNAKGLRRLFPGLGVEAEVRDFGHIAQFSFQTNRDGVLNCYGLETHAFGWPQDVRYTLGPQILRAAYPRGWATT